MAGTPDDFSSLTPDRFIWGGNTGLNMQELQQRRAIAHALASRQRGFPKNVGEGMTYLGESSGEGLSELGLRRMAAEQRAAENKLVNAPSLGSSAPGAAPAPGRSKTSDAGDSSEGPKTATLEDGSSIPLPPTNPLAGLNPQFREQFADLRSAAAEQGVNFDAPPPGSVGGKRTQEMQDSLYAQGRTAPGPIVTGTRNSNHITGQALDVRPTGGTTEAQVGKTVTDLVRNDPRFAGMRSGATFSNLYDPLHVELHRPGLVAAKPSPPAPVAEAAPAPFGGPMDQGPSEFDRVPKAQTASASPNAPIPPQGGSVLQYATVGPKVTGRGSWFGDAPGGWRDPSNGSTTASGISTAQPGIALPSGAGLKRDFRVTGPDGRTAIMPQTDKGPAAWTGRSIDVSGGGGAEMGYTPRDFPTDATFGAQQVVPLPPERPQATTEVAQGDTAAPPPAAEVAQGDSGGDTASAPAAAPAPTQVATAPAVPRSPSDTRDAVTDALLAQQAQGPQQSAQDDSQSYLQDVVGLKGRSTLQSRPTASLARGGVASDAPQLGLISPMGRLGAEAPPPPATAGAAPAATAPAAPDQSADPVRDAITQTLVAQAQQQQQGGGDPPLSAVAGLTSPQSGAPDISQQPGAVGPQVFGGQTPDATAAPQQTASNPPTVTDIKPMPVGGAGDQLAQAKPAVDGQGLPVVPGALPSREQIPPASLEKRTPPSATPPVRLRDIPMSPDARRAQMIMDNPDVSQGVRDHFKHIFEEEEKGRTIQQQHQDNDYINQRQQWDVDTRDYNKWLREEPTRILSDLKTRVEVEVGMANARKIPLDMENVKVLTEKSRAELADILFKQGRPREQALQEADLKIKELTKKINEPEKVDSHGTQYQKGPNEQAYSIPAGLPKPDLTEVQSRGVLFAGRAKRDLDALDNEMGYGKALTGVTDHYLAKLPLGIGNMAISDDYRKANNAFQNWGGGFLQLVSGQAVTEGEADRNLPAFKPAPGDTANDLVEKAQRRRALMDTVGETSGSAGMAIIKKMNDEYTARDLENAAKLPPVRVNSPDETRLLKPGQRIILPDGREGTVPPRKG